MNERQQKYLQIAKDIAKEKGGRCVSDEYISFRSNLEWECNKSHKWVASLRNIKERDGWCPVCRDHKRKHLLLIKIKPILTKKGWDTVEGEIEGWKKRTLTIKCNEGHEWLASPQSIKYNNCPECVKRCYDRDKHMLEIKQIVEAREGEIISGSYQNLKSVFVVKCERGHEWKAKAAGLKNNKWCPTCHGRNNKEQLKTIRFLAEQNGGKCLSNEYIGKDDKLEFECMNGHTFWMSPNNVKNGQRCPYCSWYFMEHKTRFALEKLLDYEFNPNGKRISPFILDGYTQFEDGKEIAFEYHGRQHYEFVRYFHKTREEFEKRKKDDEEKVRRCIEENIHLIIIPYFKAATDELLLGIIREELDKIGLKTSNINDVELFFKDYYMSCPPMERLKRTIKEKEGFLLTQEYNGRPTPITVKCKKGHVWTTKASNLFSNRWCPYCSNVSLDKKWHYEKLKKVVTNKEGVLHTKEYTNNRAEVEIQCKRGHTFRMRVHNLVSLDQWCPYCAGLTRDKEWHYRRLKKFVEEKGGILLTPSYTSSKDKVKVQCDKGHIFEKSVNNLKSHGQWCLPCKKENSNSNNNNNNMVC